MELYKMDSFIFDRNWSYNKLISKFKYEHNQFLSFLLFKVKEYKFSYDKTS
jgi:hypothetical protein